MPGSTENSRGVFGSVRAVAGKPTEMPAEPGIPPGALLIPGMAQSLLRLGFVLYRAGFADAAPHGALKDWVTKKGGLNPGLGFE